MQIDRIKIFPVRLPFSDEFAHSLRKRNSAKNIVVELTAENGKTFGYGEGAPRPYVTGETQEAAIKNIVKYVQSTSFPWEINDTDTIWRFTDEILKNPETQSAVCAIETALLDALAQSQGKSVMDYFPHDFYTESIFYGAGLPLADAVRIRTLSSLIKTVLGIHRIKLKLGESFKKNRQAFESVRQIYGENVDLKVDVNGVWNHKLAMAHIDLINEYNVRVVEQPMWPNDPEIAEFAAQMKSDGVFLMADESACSLDDVKSLHKENFYTMINVRISKCGGLRNSLGIINYLRKKKMRFQIGCHLGESGILSAAGRLLNLLCRDAVYYDGSYDSFLLKKNITVENVSFGPGGKAGPLPGPGLGIKVNPDNLAGLSANTTPITVTRP